MERHLVSLLTSSMVQLRAVTDYITSLAEAEQVYGLVRSQNPNFFTEWQTGLGRLEEEMESRLDLLKSRYLYHRQYVYLLESAMNFLVVSPLLELAGFYDPPFRLRSEVSVQFELLDESDQRYQGQIDALVVKENFWIVLVESKGTSFNPTTALPQALAYLASSEQPGPLYGLISNGEYSMFTKLEGGIYDFSDDFSLNRRRNELKDVLKILNRLKQI